MARSIALANQKGGVGKTTTAIHLAHGLALRGAKVLLVDLDPQGNAAVAMQGDLQWTKNQGPQEILERCWLLDAAGASPTPDPACTARIEAATTATRPDWVVFDCPPRMDDWGRLGLRLSQQVIVPVQSEFLALHGLSQILSTIRAEGRCQLAGVLATMVDARDQVAEEVVRSLRASLADLVFESVIFRDAAVVEAASHAQSVFSYSPRCKAALCYGEFLREVCDG